MSHRLALIRLALIPGQLTETLGPGDKVGGLDFGPVWEPAGSVTNGGTLVTAVTTVVILGTEVLIPTKAHITKDMLMELVITLHHELANHLQQPPAHLELGLLRVLEEPPADRN